MGAGMSEMVVYDNLVIEYGQSAGRVVCWGKTLHFSASLKDGCYVSVPQETFDRLVGEGRLNKDGTVAALEADK